MRLALFLILSLGFAEAMQAATSTEQHQKLVDTCRWLSKQDLAYGQSWQPPGHPYVITMDCSNTVRYIVWKVFGLNLPRTAGPVRLSQGSGQGSGGPPPG